MVCEKLKVIYFKDLPWVDCYKTIAQRFTELKKIARKFYYDKNEIEILKELNKYTHNAIKDAFEMAECST
jgi:hypothetical protein